MTFMHKLSKRLAQCYGMAIFALLALTACEASRVSSVIPPSIAQVMITPDSVDIDPGQFQQFQADGRDAAGDSAPASVTWSVTSGSITSAGAYVADTTLADAVVTASVSGSNLSATARVRKRRVVRVVLTPANATIAVGSGQTFTAIGIRNSGDTVGVNANFSATGGIITNAGVYSAGLAAGSYRVIAVDPRTSLADTSTLLLTAAPVAPVASVTISPAAASVAANSTVQLTASTRDSAGGTLSGRPIAWASSNTAVASVSASGLVTGVAQGGGTAAVIATSEGQADTATVTVTAAPVAPVTSVTVSPASASLATGATRQFTATLRDAAGNLLSGRTTTWTSSNAAAATVSATGLVTGVAAGTAAITATSEGQSGSGALAVTTAPPSSCTPTGSGVCRYVDAAAGNDANPGTSAQPYRTLQKAGSVVNPGDVVIVRDGVYTGGSDILSLSRSGTAAAWIVVKAANKWGAVIDGQNNSSAIGIKVSGSYIRVEGFEIFGTNHYGIEVYGGSNVQVAMNHIHDVGRYCTSSSNGIVGIDAYASNLLIEQNVVHDIGRLAHGEAGCTTTNNYWMNHDHGVYQGQGDNLIIRNNVFYNFTRGWAIQRYSGSGTVVANLQIVNNTFVGANPNRDGQIIIATAVTGLVITNNIFMQPKTAGIYFSTSGVTGTVANNLTYGASLSTGSALGMVMIGNQTGDPMFVNASGRNYRLQSGSPAIAAGLILSLVTNDCDGVLRPSGVAPDVGAYQH